MAEFKLLICDDEKVLLETFTSYFSHFSIDVTGVSDSKQALKILTESPKEFDAVLSDIAMPGLDGLSLLAHLRSQGVEVPFVLITGFGDKQMAIRALRLGAFDFLEKPCPMDLIIDTMKKALYMGQRKKEADIEMSKEAARLNIPEKDMQAFKKRFLEMYSVKHLIQVNNLDPDLFKKSS